MHQVIITSCPGILLKWEVRLGTYDNNFQHKLNKMGFRHWRNGVYLKELYNPKYAKESFYATMKFLRRHINKKDFIYLKQTT